jgi:hypothetical protein
VIKLHFSSKILFELEGLLSDNNNSTSNNISNRLELLSRHFFSFLRTFYRNVFFNDSCSARRLLVDYEAIAYIKDGQIFDLIKYEMNDVTYSSNNTGVPARGTVRAETAAKFPRPAILPGASTATTFSANTICLSACLSTTTRSSSFYSITHTDICNSQLVIISTWFCNHEEA